MYIAFVQPPLSGHHFCTTPFTKSQQTRSIQTAKFLRIISPIAAPHHACCNVHYYILYLKESAPTDWGEREGSVAFSAIHLYFEFKKTERYKGPLTNCAPKSGKHASDIDVN